VGVSRDKPATLKSWAEKLSLPFRLLSDPEAKVHKQYGAWGQKTLYGKTSEGVIRSTFIVGRDGKLLKAWIGVSAKGNAAQTLAGLAGDG